MSKFRNICRCLAMVFSLLPFGAGAADSEVRFDSSESPTRIVAKAAPAGASLSLHLVEPDSDQLSGPILSDQRKISESQIELTPRFQLVAGQSYRALLSVDHEAIAQADWTVPQVRTPIPKVSSIFPTASKLPANLLKFHISFSESMRQGRDIFDRVHIVDNQTGQTVEAPWRRQELWSEDHRQLTLWIHPGRVKQGVNLRSTMGPVLLPNKSYSLIIDQGLLSLPGKPTAEATKKMFTTTAEDHRRPTAQSWQLTLPRIGSNQALIVESPEALDTPLALRYLSLTDHFGEAVKCTLVTRDVADNQGRRYAFLPQRAWRNEPYTIHAGTFLEDLAGNTPTRIFDTDLDNPEAEATESDLQRTFRPLPAETDREK